MTYYKQFIILFGGFQDTSQQTKYLNDLWVYDTSKFEWKEIKFAPLTATPDPRSSFTLLPHETGAVLFGGYSRIRAGATAGNSGKGGKQGPKAGSLLTPHVWQDSWLLRIHIREDIKGTEQPPTIRWERRKKPAQLPDPARAGCTMAYHKGRGILFGGVADEEADEERIQSEYFAEMYTWNIAKNRFYPMGVRKRAHQAKRAVNVDRLGSRRDRAKADEEELMANLKRLEAKAQGIAGVSTDDVAMPDAPAEGSNIPTPEKPVLYEMPHRRFNAQLAVVDDTLFIYGGTFEQNDREFTFDEMYSIDLGRMDGLKEVFRRELPNWEGSEDEESESESEDDDEDEDEDADADDDEAVADQSMESRQDKASSPMTDEAQPDPTTATSALSPPEPETPEQEPVEDNLPHPRAFESLRDFFTRTSVDWQEAIIAQKQQASESAAASAAGRLERSIKELRGLAFEQAEQQWWACREEVIRLEDEAEEAGMGEVVNLAERDGGASGAGRRR